MAGLARIALEGGGSILVESTVGFDGPVKAGRVGETNRRIVDEFTDVRFAPC